MKTKLLLSLFIISLLLTGCGTKLLVFTGESENWTAKITTSQQDDLQESEIFLEYKGADPSSVKEFNYFVESNVENYGREGATLNKGGALREKGNMNRGSAKVTEKTVIEVLIEWNGIEETLTLKQK
ncbi:hypothetical protein [Streptomyces californicus]|uniref:hypothetical protein n=1 Tax=Streptomyces californicus TaxID=67351 RepID=UPI00365F2A62